MASANETLQPDYSKEDKDFENVKCQAYLEEPQTPEITPSVSSDITVTNINTNSNTVSNVSAAEVKLTEPQDAHSESCGNKSTDSNLSDRKLKSEEVTIHPLQLQDSCDYHPDNDPESDEVRRTNKKNRHVFFPEDGNIVSGYMEPPSPWNDGVHIYIY